MGSSLRFACVMVGWLGVAVPEARAIIIRDDVDDAEYVVADADHPALVDLIEPGDCIGTLIDPEWLLTVSHCAVDLEVGRMLDVAGVEHMVAEVVLHPQWEDGDRWDIALVRFEDAVVGVEPIPVYRGSAELGATVEIVGRGVTATGLVGENGGDTDGKLRCATNVVGDVTDFLLAFTFERPGEEGITPLEGVGAAGDSGCPVLIEIEGEVFVAGLNAFGEGGDGVGIGEYGARDYQTRVSRYAAWIDEVTAEPESASASASASASGCSCSSRASGFGRSAMFLLVIVARRRCFRSDPR